MPLVADQDDGVPFLGVADGLEVDLDHQRAGGVDGQEAAVPGLVADLRRDAVGAVEQGGASGTSSSDSTKTMPRRRNLLDDELVVDDLVIDVERRPEELQGPLQALDGHVDPAQKPRGFARMIFIACGSSRIARSSTSLDAYARGGPDQGPISGASSSMVCTDPGGKGESIAHR